MVQAGDPLSAWSGFRDLTEPREVETDVALDPSLGPGAVVISASLAVALGRGGRGVAWLHVRPNAAPRDQSPAERLVDEIFAGVDRMLHVASVGPIELGDDLVRSGLRVGPEYRVQFLAADQGTVTSTREEPCAEPGVTLHVVELEWVKPAEPGDRLIDARGRTLTIVGYELPGAATVTTVLPRDERVDEVDPATPVDELTMSVRAEMALRELGIRTVGQLAAATDAELLRTSHMKPQTLQQLREALRELPRRRSVVRLDDPQRLTARSAEELVSPVRLAIERGSAPREGPR